MSDTQQSRRGVLRWLGASAAVGIAGVGTSAAAGRGRGPRKGASGENTIVDIAAANDNLETLVSALEATGLDAVLSTEDEQFTVFAPTDTAFTGVDTSGLSTELLRSILLYHVTDGRRYAASVVNAPGVEMLNGDTVSVDGTVLNGGQATIDKTNIEASNGVIHVIDAVLLP